MKKIFKILMLALLPVFASANERIVVIGGVAEIVSELGYAKKIIGADLTAMNISGIKWNKGIKNIGYIRAINAENIISISPDLVIADSGTGPENQVKLLKVGLKNTHILPPAYTLEDVYKRISITGNILGSNEKAKQIINSMKVKHKKLSKKLEGEKKPPKVMAIMMRSGMVIATGDKSSLGAVVKMAGGKNVFPDIPSFQNVANEAIINMNPDVIVVLNHSMGKKNIKDLYKHPAIATTNAGKNKRIYEIPTMFVLSFGTKTVEAIELMAKMFYPNKFK